MAMINEPPVMWIDVDMGKPGMKKLEIKAPIGQYDVYMAPVGLRTFAGEDELNIYHEEITLANTEVNFIRPDGKTYRFQPSFLRFADVSDGKSNKLELYQFPIGCFDIIGRFRIVVKVTPVDLNALMTALIIEGNIVETITDNVQGGT